MAVIAITRAGRGMPFRFATINEADEHPLIQFGDPLIARESDLPDCFTISEAQGIASGLGANSVIREIEYVAGTKRSLAGVWRELFVALDGAAKPPPEDPAVIVQLIRDDRRATKVTGVSVKSTRKEVEPMTEAAVNEAPKSRTVRPKFPETAVIRLKADESGNKYGSTNNPKREGTKAFEKFAKYADGMTVAQALEAGIPGSSIYYDLDHGYISVE